MSDILSQHQIDQFVREGFVRIDKAFPKELAEEARNILWNDMNASQDDPATWTQPVIRLGMYTQAPFINAANTAGLHRAFDQLVGPDQWAPCRAMGTFPVRFPSPQAPGDTGWHVDAGFPGTDPSNYFEWRINLKSKGRALLMLFLFSDVAEEDAPTRIRVGSHLKIAKLLKEYGDEGVSFMELAGRLKELPAAEEILATGPAGTVYLCHPFLVHAAQPHRGRQPRFMAQPPLISKSEFILENKVHYFPVEEAVRKAIE